jgi:hypothetical protein
MTIIRKPTAAGLSDPSIVRQAEASLAQSSIIANGKPAVVNSGLVLPSTTIATTSNTVVATTSTNNQSADTVTIYETGGNVYVSSIDQTIRKTTINNPIAGVSSIIAGNNITITSSNNDGTGNVTINATGGGGGGNTFSAITMSSTPSGPSNQIKYGLGNLVAWNDGGWALGVYNGANYGTEGMRLSPGIEGSVEVILPADQDAATNSLELNNYAGNVQVNANNNYWNFDNTGQINIPEGSSSFNDGRIQSANGYPTLLGYGSGDHGGPELDWMDGDDPANNISNSSVLRNTMYINGTGLTIGINENEVANSFSGRWQFGTDGNLTTPGVSGNITGANVIEANTVTANTFASTGNLQLVAGEALWTLTDTGSTVFPTISVQRGDNPSGTITGQTLLFGDNTQEAIISTPDGNSTYNNSQRLVINPGAGAPGTGGEGGDIYLWAGRGGNASGSGGDIKIRGGQGGANTSGGSGGDGGYIRIEAGDASNSAVAGYIQITGGQGGISQPGGYVEILGGQGATIGGSANLKGGYGTATGGNVNIWGGASGNGQVNEGHVNIQTGGNTWIFDPNGNLTAPGNAYFAGQNMFIGEGSNTLGFSASTLVISADNNAYIQAAVTNVSDIGSADWVAYGHRGDDGGGWVDMGFTSSGYSDANFTITGQGDGYVFVETFVDGQSPGGRGGNLVLATGENGTVNDIIFATGGFALANEFGKISDANNALELTRAGASITLPAGGIISETGIPFGGLTGNTIALTPAGGSNVDQQLLVYPTAGQDFNHLHLTSGNLYNTELFLGDDNLYVKLANTGDVVINSNDNTGNTAQWTFGTDGNVSVPGNTLIYTPIATSGAGGNSITIQAGSSDSFASNPGGNLNLIGGYGSFGDGGGPPGGNVNIVSGGSSDSHAGNVTIATGSNDWIFDYTGNLTTPGEVIINSNNAHGGAGYAGIMTMTNTIGGSTNPNKFVRLNSTGSLEIINSAYSNTILGLSDGGNLTVFGYAKTTATTITLLGSASTAGAGARAFATDANLVAEGNFGVAVGGSGSNAVPVYSDGTVWRIG